MTILTKDQETLSTVMSATEKKTTKRNETKRPFHSNEKRRSLHTRLSSAEKDQVNRVAWPPRNPAQ